jgi:hypothetical protein
VTDRNGVELRVGDRVAWYDAEDDATYYGTVRAFKAALGARVDDGHPTELGEYGEGRGFSRSAWCESSELEKQP